MCRWPLAGFLTVLPVVAAPGQEDPRGEDVRALTALVRRHGSYVEHRRRLSGVDPEALERGALAALVAGDPRRRGRRDHRPRCVHVDGVFVSHSVELDPHEVLDLGVLRGQRPACLA